MIYDLYKRIFCTLFLKLLFFMLLLQMVKMFLAVERSQRFS